MAASNSERRTERNTIHTRETFTVRTRSPVKLSRDQHAGNKRTRDGEKVTPIPEERPKKPSEPKPWNPQASIIQHTTAPLASRISVPPLASSAPQPLQPQPLNQLSLEQQEKAIIEDLLFVFMGFEGQYVRYMDSYDPLEEKERLVGPSYRILLGLDPSLRDLTTSMLKMASHYTAVDTFIEVQSRGEYGAVSHALCAAIRKLLQEYLILMAQLEHQMLTNPDFTLHVLNLQIKPTSHMLFQLYNLAIELLKANGVLVDDSDDSMESDSDDDFPKSLLGGSNKKVCKGGSVLGLITKRLAAMAGDPSARSLLTTLLREASRPYMTMLNEWLHHGGIKDPHGEFLIKEVKSIKREELDEDYTNRYWEQRYTISESVVPPQLEGLKDKVLLAGKYLNVVRECGGVDISKEVRDVPTKFDDPRFLENVNNAYAYANSSLLTLLLTTHALPARLRSLKHYYFLDRSDFFTYFLELGTSELKKVSREVNVPKLQSLLDIVLRQPGSVAADDPYKEDVKVVMDKNSLTDWLMKIVNVTGLDQDASTGAISEYTPQTSNDPDSKINGFEALVLDYIVPFPLSLFVSRVTLTRYQLLFRYLLSLRHLEAALITSWTDHSKGIAWRHRSSNPRIERAKRRAWTLRARMLVFVQQLVYYSTAEVIEPNWQALMTRLKMSEKKAEGETESTETPGANRTVDELMQDHVDFLATCLKECMLTNAKLLKINARILSTCRQYASFTTSFGRYIQAGDPDLSDKQPNASTQQAAYDPAKLDKLDDALGMFEVNFSRHLKILLDTLNYLAATETVVFLSLCARLSNAGEGG
ncbi:hypothetical protein BT63DRAFT_378381 [Microthyrium microscopicum]|uniref:Spindle pole body component n=1 Tax=Microthyrium microscopicum TaxID=703497 RepID=A0A6A6TZK0_9PEZI|nr:hypothetical protein BT63DRAFT_378381 [Microthyrium microscopicum]